MKYHVLIGADDDVGAWVYARTPHPQPWTPGSGVAIGWTCEQRLVAGVTYTLYTGANVWAAIASEDHGWINRSNLGLIFHYPFRQLRVRRMSALVDASNTRSQRFVERLGFTREATLVDAAVDGDQYVYRLFERDCRWLRRDSEQRRKAPQTP